MTRALSIAVVLVGLASGPSASTAATAAPDAVCPPPRCVDVEVPVPPGVHVPERRVRVLLPEGYDATCDRYPVLYVLHGVGDTYTDWSEMTDIVSLTASLPLIVVMPDGGRNTEAGWYSNWKDGSRQWETFHAQVLVDHVDRTFRTRGDGHRGVLGNSMGGFGAMMLAARHRGLYAVAASFSGAVDTRYVSPVSGVGYEVAHSFGTPDDRVWGDQLADEETWTAHNPTDRAADLAGTRLLLATGTGTPGGPAGDDPANAGAYAVEQGIFQMNVSFMRALTQAGVPYEQDPYVGGQHTWPYWQRELHWAMPRIMETVGSGEVCAAGGGVSGGDPSAPRVAPRASPALPASGGGTALAPAVAVACCAAALVMRRVSARRP